MAEKPKVLISQPLYAHVSPLAAMSFTSFLLEVASKGLAGQIYQTVNMYVDAARNDAVKIALGEGRALVKNGEEIKLEDISHVLFVDSDMVIPRGSLEKLLSHDVPCVGGMYFGKVPPFNPVAFSLDPFKRLDDYEPDALQRVDGLGMGFTLVATEVFRRMRDHFHDEFWFRSGEGIGEDVWLFMRMKQLGLEVYMDTSIRCGHVGELVVDQTSFDQVKRNSKANGSAVSEVSYEG